MTRAGVGAAPALGPTWAGEWPGRRSREERRRRIDLDTHESPDRPYSRDPNTKRGADFTTTPQKKIKTQDRIGTNENTSNGGASSSLKGGEEVLMHTATIQPRHEQLGLWFSEQPTGPNHVAAYHRTNVYSTFSG
ncbi:hypothetical protein NDU88_011558 [Pleurodeles waltl]|uniref:Uncharacterized protein n=1 Tax=Pleurodeles waltl TaxID=8319 RepID=A0AAV7S6I8_PLEWA|nr:hypothetical protein NDU88_011558 [Pleurodeles waltl]